MNDCPECNAAAKQLWHGFHANCEGCMARAISRSPAFHECKASGKLTPLYRALLSARLVTHDEVKAAAAADFINRRAA